MAFSEYMNFTMQKKRIGEDFLIRLTESFFYFVALDSRKTSQVCKRNELKGIPMNAWLPPIKSMLGCPPKWSIPLMQFVQRTRFLPNWAMKNIFLVKQGTGTRNCKLHENSQGKFFLRICGQNKKIGL